MSTTNIINQDPFGLYMMKPTKSGGQVWFMYNIDFNDDPQVYTTPATMEYAVHNIVDADGTRFTIPVNAAFITQISTSTGFQSAQNITDQGEMARRGYMQNTQDWRNVEVTGQFVVFKEADDFITFGFRGGLNQGTGAPLGCTGCEYLVDVHMKAGGLIRVRKKSWNTSIHNWLSGLASGFDSTKPCGWAIKLLVYNTQDAKSVNVEVWLDKDNENHYVKVLSGVDTGQINTDATVCNATIGGQPLIWGSPFIMIQGNQGQIGFKNLSIREIEGYGTTLPPIDPDPNPGPGTGGSGGGGGSGSGSGTGTGGGGGAGEPVDLTPILAVPSTNYVQYGGGPNISPLEWYVIFQGADWNKAPVTTTATGPLAVSSVEPTFAPAKSARMRNTSGDIFNSPTVDFIFWGSGWNTQSTPYGKTQIMAAMDKVFNSFYFDGLIQYGVPGFRAKRPSIGKIVVNTTYPPVNNFDEQDLGNVIIDSINHGLVPDLGIPDVIDPDEGFVVPQHMYYVIGPPHCLPDFSFVNAVAFHWYYAYAPDNTTYVYACTTDRAFDSPGTDIKYQTYPMTHEIVETMTDTIPGGGVFEQDPDPLTGDVGEIADVCDLEYNINGVIVSGYWSNQDNSCIAPTSKPSWIICPSGYVYDSESQSCIKNNVVTPPVVTPPTPTPGTANPIFKVPKTTNMAWGGGPNTSLPMEIYIIFAGSAWNSNSTYSNNKAKLKTQLLALFSSHYFDGLFQYNDGNGLGIRKPILKAIVELGSYDFPSTYDETPNSLLPAYRAATEANLIATASPAKQNVAEIWLPTPDKAYISSTVGGVHSAYTAVLNVPPGNPDENIAVFELINTSRPFAEWLPNIAHNTIEMLADNAPFKGYSNKAGSSIAGTAQFDEMADVCQAGGTGFITPSGNDFQVAKYWSDVDGACILPYANAPTVPVTCPSGYTWDPVLQVCKSNSAPNPDPNPDPDNPPPPPNTTPIVNTTFKTQIQNSITTIFQSNYFDGLFQYGLLKRPVLKGFVVNTTNPQIPAKYTTDHVNALIADSIAKGLVPSNKQTGPKNIAYMVIIRPNIVSAVNSIGEHYSHDLSPSTVTDPTKMWHYFVSVVSWSLNYGNFTDTITHELTETCVNMITIPGDGLGYSIKAGTAIQSKVAANGNELCDVCEGDVTGGVLINGVQVAKYWSDQDGKCIIPSTASNPTPWFTCHTGAIKDNTTQSCIKQASSGGGGTVPPGTGGGQGYKVTLANASGDDGNKPENAIDGKLDTRWSSFGKGQFLRLDLGAAKKVNKIKIAWYQGDKRSNHFEIWTAETTGGAYTKQLGMDSVKGSTALQDYNISPSNPVRYIRIVVNGNTLNDWASISEAEVWGPDVPATIPSTGSGGDEGSGGVTPGGDTGGGTQTPPPPTIAAYNFFDTSFSVDYQKIGLCNPVE